MLLYAVSSIVAEVPDNVERSVNQIYEYASRIGAFVAHNPNEFAIACSTVATAIFTYILATRTSGLFKETAGLREETAALATFAKQQAEDMKASIAENQKAANAAQESATVAKKTLISTQRPWVAVNDVTAEGPLKFGRAGVFITLAFRLKNVGPSPAVNVNIVNDFLPLYYTTSDFNARQTAVLQRARHTHATGFVLFPGVEIETKISTSMPREEIGKGSFPNPDGTKYFHPTIVGCVTYEFSFEEGRHHTGFALIVAGASKNILVLDEGETPVHLVAMPIAQIAN